MEDTLHATIWVYESAIQYGFVVRILARTYIHEMPFSRRDVYQGSLPYIHLVRLLVSAVRLCFCGQV